MSDFQTDIILGIAIVLAIILVSFELRVFIREFRDVKRGKEITEHPIVWHIFHDLYCAIINK